MQTFPLVGDAVVRNHGRCEIQADELAIFRAGNWHTMQVQLRNHLIRLHMRAIGCIYLALAARM
jgi:hypothetical protein